MKKNYMTLLIGLVAVVVIIESIVLISGLGKNAVVPVVNNNVVDVVVSKAPVVTGSKIDVLISSKNASMVVGKSYPVEVNAVAKGSESLDNISLYVKYDPQVLDVSGLTFDKKLPNPVFQKVSTTKGMVVVNYLITGKTGLALNSGDVLSLAKFQVTPKKAGSFNLQISTGNESKESVTMFVESATNKALPFSSNELTVNVTSK